MKVFAIALLMLFLCLSTQRSFGQTQKELVLKTAKAMETAPLDKATQGMQSDSLKWLIETEDVHLIVCGEVFGLFSDKKNKVSSDMTAAYTIGMGAYKIEFPDKTNDENAAQLAGLNLALKVYEAIVKEKPKNKFDKVDELIRKRDAGELAGIINGFNCGKK